MIKKTFFCLFLVTILPIRTMQVDTSVNFDSITIILPELPIIQDAFITNILAHSPSVNCRRTFLQYFRDYQTQEHIPRGLRSSILPLKSIQDLWNKYMSARIGATAHFILNICYNIISEYNSFLNNVQQRDSCCCDEIKNPDESYVAAVLGLALFSGKNYCNNDAYESKLKNTILDHWKECFMRNMVPLILLSFRPNCLTHIIFYESKNQISVIKDFPFAFLRNTLCSTNRSTLLTCWQNIQTLNGLLIAHLDKGLITTFPTINDALNHINEHERHHKMPAIFHDYQTTY
jgi:hypothetical protein